MNPRQFRIRRPPDTRYRAETCAHADCDAYRFGWSTVVPAVGPQADYIRVHSGRAFEEVNPGVFRFEAGQECFATHYIRREVFTADRRLHTKGEFWVEEFADHQELLAKEIANV